jgi:hypothetical protein
VQPPAPTAASAADELPSFYLRPLTTQIRFNRLAVQRRLRSLATQETAAMAEVQVLLTQGERQQAEQRWQRLRRGTATLGARQLAQSAF